MKNKILRISLFCIILIIPTVVAIISYTNARKYPITENSVSSLVMTSPDGETYTCKKSDKNNKNSYLFGAFIKMNNESFEVTELPAPASEYSSYTVDYVSHNKNYRYIYYLSQSSDNGFYKDNDGKYYKISADILSEFLISKYATCLFPSSSQPVMTVGGKSVVLPSEIVWYFKGHDDQYLESEVEKSDAKKSFEVSGGLEIAFDVKPDYFYVTLTDQLGRTVFNDDFNNLDTSIFTENIVLNAKVDAKWYQDAERLNYGEAKYEFTANVLSPAVFYVDTNEIQYGDFVVVSAKNIVDPKKIGFVSEPQIDFTPRFFESGGYYHALIPFSLDLISTNKKAPSYDLTFSYGETYQKITVNTTVRSSSTQYSKVGIEKIDQFYNSSTLQEFENAMKEPLDYDYENICWIKNSIVALPNLKIKFGYGVKVYLENARKSYINEGIDYSASANQTVGAVMEGRVIYTGETKYSGITVVIDHGAGLKSVYSHLSDSGVSVGTNVSKGETIGLVGDTGFSSGKSLRFSLYIYDVPVRPYKYSETGIRLADSVAKSLGIEYQNSIAQE